LQSKKAYDELPMLAACVTQAVASLPALSTTSDLAGEKNTITSFLVSAREINVVLIVLAAWTSNNAKKFC
jgi:hypothetical protein